LTEEDKGRGADSDPFPEHPYPGLSPSRGKGYQQDAVICRDFDSPWSERKIMNHFVRYGEEAQNTVIELTYNWETHQYYSALDIWRSE
jgi:hypothetical protein